MPTVKHTVVIVCGWCREPFETTYHLAFGRLRRFCSKSCATHMQMALHPRRPVEERFWASVDKPDGRGSCWLWLRRSTRSGYGQIQVGTLDDPKVTQAHILALEWAMGRPKPDGRHVQVIHTCDTPHCVRNSPFSFYRIGNLFVPCWGHLVLGTAALNVADMRQKGRARDPLGEDSSLAFLTEGQIRSIRQRCYDGERQVDLATEYGVSPHQIWMIVHRRSWRHVV